MLVKLLNKCRCQSPTVMCEMRHIANKYDNWLKCVTDRWLCETISKHIKYKSDTHYDNVCLHNCLCVNIGSMYFSRRPKLQHVCLSAVCICVISVCLSVSLSCQFLSVCQWCNYCWLNAQCARWRISVRLQSFTNLPFSNTVTSSSYTHTIKQLLSFCINKLLLLQTNIIIVPSV